MQTPSTEHADPPEPFESQPGGPGDDVHDHVPLSALADIVRSPGGVRSASKGGRNYSWAKTESLAAVLAREAANNSEQREKQEVRANECQRRFTACLRDVQTAHTELARKNIPGPFLPIVYRKANADMTATPEQAATQRGGNAGKSVLMRGDAIHACVAKHILPVARHKWTHRESGIYWTDVCAAVSARVDALLTTDPPMGKTDRELLSAAHYVWQWTCSENPDVVASSTLTKHAVMTFALTKSPMHPAEGYPQTREEQRSRKASRQKEQRAAVPAMRATDSAQKRKREQEEIRTAQKKVLALLEEELFAMRAERQRERTPSDDHRIMGVASGACDSPARGGGLSFASRLERAEDEDSPAENAAEGATEVPRPTEPAISPANKENVPPSESVGRDAQITACHVPVTTVEEEACVPSTDVTPACTPRRSARTSRPSVRLRRT